MKNKTIITITACMLFVLAGFSAFAGERVYIRIYEYGGTSAKVFVWQNGSAKKIEFKSSALALKDESKTEGLNDLAALLEDFFNKGFKILNVYTKSEQGFITDYILEKQ